MKHNLTSNTGTARSSTPRSAVRADGGKVVLTDRVRCGQLLTTSVLAWIVASLVGCVGPAIQRHASVALPASSAIPTQPDGTQAASATAASDPGRESEEDVADIVVRGQSTDEEVLLSPGDDALYRDAMPVSGIDATPTAADSRVRLAQYEESPYDVPGGYAPSNSYPPPGGFAPPGSYAPRSSDPQIPGVGPNYAPYDGSGVAEPFSTVGPNQYAPGGVIEPLPGDYADLVVNLRETQTGRFMFGVGVNSDLGLTAQAIIDERNFDWRRWPRSFSDIINGTAWRGGGQSLRIEAVPGTEVQRYLVNFTQPYLWDTPISFNVSGYLFDRRYFDWDEQRLGGRVGFGYRIKPDLALSLALRAEQVDFTDPRVRGIPIIESVLGESDLFSGKVSLTHDTRDIPFAPTEGHYLELSYEQVFGTFDYPRFGADYRRYFLLRQRADRSGRHTLGFSFKGGVTGSQTPVYENYFAGGYSTMRGFRFRHASPKIFDVIVGGQLSLLGSAEYIFPITADDMLKGALFCDYGTIEEEYDNIDMEDFRVAVGGGLRISVPAMGPAPIAVDFAVPLAREGTDRIQNFSFFVGFGR